MSGRVLPLQGSEHTVVDALLPWYVNGTLRGDELDRVKQHLSGCEHCRREVDWLRDVFAACAAIAPAPEGLPSSATGAIGAVAGRLEPRSAGSGLVARWRSTQPWARMLIAAQVAGLAVLGSLVAFDTRDDPAYRTLGAYAPDASTRDAIAVMFDPAMTEAQMQRVLAAAGARIVDGPTTTNAFVLEVAAGRLPEAMQKLRSERQVLFAEPLGARANR